MQYVVLWLNPPPLERSLPDFQPEDNHDWNRIGFEKHCKIPFGAYIEAHEDYDRTHTMAERTKGTICIGPTSNFQVSYKLRDCTINWQ
jgi:hypothetical protein